MASCIMAGQARLRHRPTPLPQYRDDAPLAAGPNRVRSLCERFLRRTESRAVLEAWLGSQAPPLTVCSMCSESDMPVYCVQELLRSLGAPPMDHRFSCELSAQKRRAWRVIWPSVGHLYRDVLQLSKPRVRNDITGTMEATRSGGLLYAGFPCTDASTLNP